MFGWLKNAEKEQASDMLLKAIIERENAVKNAVHKMNLVIIDKRFIDTPVLEERRHA